jgi:hypothetical protein
MFGCHVYFDEPGITCPPGETFPPPTFEVETVVSIQEGPCVSSFDSWVFIIFLMIVGLQLVHDILRFG